MDARSQVTWTILPGVGIGETGKKVVGQDVIAVLPQWEAEAPAMHERAVKLQ